MYLKEYVDFHETGSGRELNCPKCGRLLELHKGIKWMPRQQVRPGFRHTYYLNITCLNGHYFQFVRVEGIETLYEICCEDADYIEEVLDDTWEYITRETKEGVLWGDIHEKWWSMIGKVLTKVRQSEPPAHPIHAQIK